MTPAIGGDSVVPVREAHDNVLSSSAMPAIRVRVAAPFRFLGTLRFQIKGIAEAEIVYFADVRDGRIERAFHAQFEHFLEHTEHTYNYRMPQVVRLGQHEYMYDTHVFNAATMASEHPESDGAHKHSWLTGMGYADLAWTVSQRFVRVIGEARRAEVLLIYQEALDATLAEDLCAQGRESDRWVQMEDALHARALQTFSVIEG